MSHSYWDGLEIYQIALNRGHQIVLNRHEIFWHSFWICTANIVTLHHIRLVQSGSKWFKTHKKEASSCLLQKISPIALQKHMDASTPSIVRRLLATPDKIKNQLDIIYRTYLKRIKELKVRDL